MSPNIFNDYKKTYVSVLSNRVGIIRCHQQKPESFLPLNMSLLTANSEDSDQMLHLQHLIVTCTVCYYTILGTLGI